MSEQRYVNSVNLNQGSDFPYLVLDAVDDDAFPRNPGFRVMHWHDDLQFIYVLSGSVEVTTLETRMLLQQGEGAFINKNVVHLVQRQGPCHYKSFIFPDYFLKFYPGCPAAEALDQIESDQGLATMHITKSSAHQDVLAALSKLCDLEPDHSPLYALEVLTALCALWLELCRVTQPRQAATQKNLTEERMTAFLRFIEQHYSETVSLDSLARSANVSKSECLRCFKVSLQVAPYQYLMEYRLSKAAELLRTTDAPVSKIANQVGFSQSSHFGKCFREKTGLTPTEYRRSGQRNSPFVRSSASKT